MKIMSTLTLAALLAFTATVAQAAPYTVDASHSSVGFQIRHLAISKVNGTFNDFTGEFAFEAGNPDAWSVKAVIQTASIDTGNKDRDEHLRSGDFFEAETYPTITFESTGVTMKNDNAGTLRGNLTIHGVTKQVELDLEFLGTATDPWGNAKAGFSLSGKINRKDFGLTWSKALETGGLVVGDEVKLQLEIEGNLVK